MKKKSCLNGFIPYNERSNPDGSQREIPEDIEEEYGVYNDFVSQSGDNNVLKLLKTAWKFYPEYKKEIIAIRETMGMPVPDEEYDLDTLLTLL